MLTFLVYSDKVVFVKEALLYNSTKSMGDKVEVLLVGKGVSPPSYGLLNMSSVSSSSFVARAHIMSQSTIVRE